MHLLRHAHTCRSSSSSASHCLSSSCWTLFSPSSCLLLRSSCFLTLCWLWCCPTLKYVVRASGRDGLGGRAYSQAASPPEWRSALLVEKVGGVWSCMSWLREAVVFGDDENWGMGFSGRDGLGGRAYSQGASPPEWRSALLVEMVGGVRSCMSWLREAVVFGDENSGLCCNHAVCQCTGCRVPWTKWQC
jgi:hypothetical protein